MAYDMFRCPKCNKLIFDYDWGMGKIDESKPDEDEDNWIEAFTCTECDISYTGEELNRLVSEFCKPTESKYLDCIYCNKYRAFSDSDVYSYECTLYNSSLFCNTCKDYRGGK